MIQEINSYFTDIYFHLHPQHQEAISHQSIRILHTIQKKHDVMIGDIAEQLSISHNTASEHVKKLVHNGWVLKERSVEDQRRVYLHLTHSGLTILKKNTELDEDKLQNALNRLSVGEREQLKESFRLLSEVSK